MNWCRQSPAASGIRYRLTFAAVLLTGSLALTGCVAGQPSEVEATTTPEATASASATPKPQRDPELLPGGSALANRDYFDFVNERLLEQTPDAKGKAIIDNLVVAGFDKAAMQVTPDATPGGLAVDSIEFSVLAGGDCLIGQVRGADYTSTIAPVLSNGACLVGKTRTIDW
jgi:hypothetical protein